MRRTKSSGYEFNPFAGDFVLDVGSGLGVDSFIAAAATGEEVHWWRGSKLHLNSVACRRGWWWGWISPPGRCVMLLPGLRAVVLLMSR